MSHSLPETCQGLVLRDFSKGPSIETIPTPKPGPGSAVIKVLASSVVSQMAEHIVGGHPLLKLAIPLVPGYSGIGRIAALGPDATTLTVDQLVLIEPMFRGRDDSNVSALWTVSGPVNTPEMNKLVEDSWRDGMWAEYARVPLENCHTLDEKRLLGSPREGGLGYDVADLTYIPKQLISYGGLRDIDLKAGERILIAPATGGFSGTAVEVASAMGAQVVAAGRNANTLKRLAEKIPRVKTVQLTGDVEKDAQAFQQFGRIDAYMEYSPQTNPSGNHFKSAIKALRPRGRVSVEGGPFMDLPVGFWDLIVKNITIKGKFMYEVDDAKGIIKLVEAGLLKLGESGGIEMVGKYKIDEWEKAIKASGENTDWGKNVVFVW